MSKFPIHPRFDAPLGPEEIKFLESSRKRCSANAILATTLATCGHPGGSLSSIPLLLSVYAGISFDPQCPLDPKRDRVFISHGHTSPGTYSVLAETGHFSAREMILQFREASSRYAGHVEIDVPGIEWGTGNLGQGLSAGAASAFASKLFGGQSRSIVLMGDGEQQKGQLSEARRFAVKYGLNNLIGMVDYNGLQIGGKITDIMPQNIAQGYRADGWNVLEVDGRDIPALYESLAKAYHHDVADPKAPTVIIARTVMGYGVSFIENKHEYHGKALSGEQAQKALSELGIQEDIDALMAERKSVKPAKPSHPVESTYPVVDPGKAKGYGANDALDNRSAYGNALADLGKINNASHPKVIGITCDLTESVKMGAFAKASPSCFIESGIQEHHAATFAGRLSTENLVVFFSTFGVFGAAETYNQLRLNTINRANVKVVCTHVGLNVGEDGPTHQSIDYIGLVSSLFGIRLSIPADPNQTDHIIRTIATLKGNDFVAMGRDKAPIILDENGQPFFGPDYRYVPGKADWLRKGEKGTFIATGPMVPVCLQAHELLKKEGLSTGVLNLGSVLPLDREAILEAAQKGAIVTAEDHHVQTGIGSLVANVIAERKLAIPFVKMGVSHYGSSGKIGKLYEEQGLTAENIASVMRNCF